MKEFGCSPMQILYAHFIILTFSFLPLGEGYRGGVVVCVSGTCHNHSRLLQGPQPWSIPFFGGSSFYLDVFLVKTKMTLIHFGCKMPHINTPK